MNRRRSLLAFAALGALPLRARGQRALTVRRIGYLSTRIGPNEFEQAFLRGMRERGYVEGKNLVVDFRWSGGDLERHRTAAAEVVASKPDVIVWADGAGLRSSVSAVDPAIPVVIPAMADPIASGVTQSLSHPDSNITGVSVLSTELSRKRLELLKETVPGLQRVGSLYNANRASPPTGVAPTRSAGEALGITIIDMRMVLPDGVAGGFASAVAQGVQGVVIVSDTATISHRAALGDAALAHRLPTIFANRTYLRGGGLMSYGPDLEGAFHRASYFVDRLLKGARAADLPIEQPERFQLIVSQRTAKTLGLTIPQSILLRADEVT